MVTTAGRPTAKLISAALCVAEDLNITFINRNKRSVKTILEQFKEPVIVIGADRYEVYSSDSASPFFFHPNSSAFRLKRMEKGEIDPLIHAADLKKGDRFIDCTLGMASDAIIASHATGVEGEVTGIEKNNLVGYLVEKGLAEWKTENKSLEQAMRRIAVRNGDHLSFLQGLPDRSVDVVYFDPMFSEEIKSSSGIAPLRLHADYSTDSLGQAIEEAKRAARKRVVLKDHFRSLRFSEFGFTVLKRPSSKQHYGFIMLD
ncbi:class I SAM-dependent methyltransferase [Jeotgalibacillus proteolyticus]|uniref:SAM-dependent methyltransferase n=1 Tax=Jeotgalibacillus proteolyticus TaxID=2082395 RepID=A0A2S5GFD8_9BACL|nr:class I SAM-dependent methyltransferase [Jeotgalibacillus proteolyticus]PPA71762.1 hypothetical protein C4B60_03815 [Jeotgalibacillus proteolyticus]